MVNEEGPDMAMPATVEPAQVPGDVLTAFLGLDVPPGFRAELIEGEIVVSPPPNGDHEDIISDIVVQLTEKSSTRVFPSGNKGLVTPRGRYIPDSVITPPHHFRGHESWAPTDGILMVLEVTSNRVEKDRHHKRRGYAAAGIPLYLLVDRSADEVVLWSDPAGDAYRGELRVSFGKGLDLPEPFSCTLDTDEFA